MIKGGMEIDPIIGCMDLKFKSSLVCCIVYTTIVKLLH